MVTPAIGSVVLVRFPFSDLANSKLRPAVVLADVSHGDWLLCQVTSNPYADSIAVEITNQDFVTGALSRTSYARPGKLFSANTVIMERIAGELHQEKMTAIIDAVIALLRPEA